MLYIGLMRAPVYRGKMGWRWLWFDAFGNMVGLLVFLVYLWNGLEWLTKLIRDDDMVDWRIWNFNHWSLRNRWTLLINRQDRLCFIVKQNRFLPANNQFRTYAIRLRFSFVSVVQIFSRAVYHYIKKNKRGTELDFFVL